MSKKKKRCIPAHRWLFFLGLCCLLPISGCKGQGKQEIPVLEEPVAANGAYRPVEQQLIGDLKVLYGTVVPVEYGCFYEQAVEVCDIRVKVGEYVKKGAVIATAEVEQIKKQMERLQAERENLIQNRDLTAQIAQLQQEKLAAEEVPWQDVSGNLFSPGDVSENRVDWEATGELWQERETELAVAGENASYDTLLCEYKIQRIEQQIGQLQRLVADSALYAPHDGYVVYVKNTAVTTSAGAFENLAVIADREELCLELDRTLEQYSYKDYEFKYLKYAGKNYPVTELSYGEKAEALALARGCYPKVRLRIPEELELTSGEMCPVFYRQKDAEPVIAVGLDSLKGTQDAAYVYVRDENGSKEKRSVRIGERDSLYAEVLEGLQEGEQVYYEAGESMPSSYTEYEAVLSDYAIENTAIKYQQAEDSAVWYTSDQKGTLLEILVKEGEQVEKGALLYRLQSEAGKAALTEASYALTREDKQYADTVEKLEKRKQLEKNDKALQILELQKQLETINHNYRKSLLQREYEEMAADNNGSGVISVYARQAGTIGQISGKKGKALEQNTPVLSIEGSALPLLVVWMTEVKGVHNYPDHIAALGNRITITAGDNSYAGTCVGWTVHSDTNLDQWYVTGSGEKAELSYCADSGYNAPGFYVEMENPDFYETLPLGTVKFPYVTLKQVITVPTDLVGRENNAVNPAKTDYFVWKVTSEGLVKQYVRIDSAFSDLTYTVILNGVNAGDVLAREN